MRFSVFMTGTALALLGGSGAYAQLGVGSSVGGAVGAAGDVTAHTPTVPGTIVPDTTADAARMTAGAKTDLDAAGQAGATTGKKSKHRKHKGSTNTSAGASATTNTTAGAGTNAGTTGGQATTATEAEAGTSASVGGSNNTGSGSATLSTGSSANMETKTAPGGR